MQWMGYPQTIHLKCLVSDRNVIKWTIKWWIHVVERPIRKCKVTEMQKERTCQIYVRCRTTNLWDFNTIGKYISLLYVMFFAIHGWRPPISKNVLIKQKRMEIFISESKQYKSYVFFYFFFLWLLKNLASVLEIYFNIIMN